MTLKQFIDNPENWPNWPFLSVKRADRSLENKNLGVLIDEHNGTRTIFHVNYFDIPMNGLKGVPKTEYPNTDAMIADGWVVD